MIGRRSADWWVGFLSEAIRNHLAGRYSDDLLAADLAAYDAWTAEREAERQADLAQAAAR